MKKDHLPLEKNEEHVQAPSAYLDLLKKTLTAYFNIGSLEYHPLDIVHPNWKTRFLYPIHRLLKKRNFGIVKMKLVDREKRIKGQDWPAQAFTMIGMNRLSNIEALGRSIIKDKIAGDFIETGVWRGGATIFMRALLKELEVSDRKVWLADSFQGLPIPNEQKYPEDKASKLHQYKILSASREEVESNFKKFNLLDDQVVIVEGWFKDTLPKLEIERIALLRLDGDLYESTALALEHLYPKLSAGGYVIIDDYHAFPFCKSAVDTYRTKQGITAPIVKIDDEAVYWRVPTTPIA